jgi:hypothetical protein
MLMKRQMSHEAMIWPENSDTITVTRVYYLLKVFTSVLIHCIQLKKREFKKYGSIQSV